MTSFPVSPPEPKPRSRYSRNSFSSAPSDTDSEHPDLIRTRTETWTGPRTQTKDEAPPSGLSLGGVSDLIAAHIPSLSGMANEIRESTSSRHQVPPLSVPSAPPSSALANRVAETIPSLSAEAQTFGAFTDVSSLAVLVSGVTNVNANEATPPAKKLLPPEEKPLPRGVTDVSALSDLVKSLMEPNVPNIQETQDSNQAKVEYLTMLSHWTSREEMESESSNEEEEAEVPTQVPPAPSRPAPSRPAPSRPPPPPPKPPSQSKKPKERIPRAATLRVSRKKGPSGVPGPAPKPSVSRCSWLDVWKGIRHNVVWATFDGQVMSLWKKRTDHFSEVLFHVSNITNIKKHENGRFSVYLQKKRYDFMAHNHDVQEGWVSALLLARGCSSPAPPVHHGPITLKDPRGRAYAAVMSSQLWVFPNKDSFQAGVASFSVQLNVASVKKSGKHAFSLTTPFKTFSISVESSKDLRVWLDTLSSSISSSLGSSQMAQRLWEENPSTKLCGDCGAPNPEWASVNLLLVLCQKCAGVHRSLGHISKVKSLTMDNKVWSEALIQLFISLGNRVANQIWAPVVPATEQLSPDSLDDERSKFIQDKYSRGRYRRLHALAYSPDLMNQRLLEAVYGPDVEETLSLICSGAKVTPTDPLSPAPLQLAERAGQSLQVQLLRLNEFTEVPPPHPVTINGRTGSTPSCEEEEEELHGKLEDERFLFSLENNSAACDVLDLREVHSVHLQDGNPPQFQIHSLNQTLICAADSTEDLLSHFHHILTVILPAGVTGAEVGGALAVSKVCVVEMSVGTSQSDAWILLGVGGVILHQSNNNLHLQPITRHEMDSSENILTLDTKDRSVTFRFEDTLSCTSWFHLLCTVLKTQPANQSPVPVPAANQRASLYPVMSVKGHVPPAIERCISHVTNYGLKVEGVYRRCGLTNKVNRLVEALMTSPSSAPLESDEQGVLDAAAVLKRLVRQREGLIPENAREAWLKAAVISDESSRFVSYKRLLHDLPHDNRATLNALFAHLYMVQLYSQINRMSAQNLALVLIPTLFQTLNQDLVRLLREFIIHQTLLFTVEDQITFL